MDSFVDSVERASQHHRYTRPRQPHDCIVSQSCFPIDALKLDSKLNSIKAAKPCQEVRIPRGARRIHMICHLLSNVIYSCVYCLRKW